MEEKEKESPTQLVIERINKQDKKRQKDQDAWFYSITYPMHTGEKRSVFAIRKNILESLKNPIRATVPGELQDGKGNRYLIEDYATFLTHTAVAIYDYQNWERQLRIDINYLFFIPHSQLFLFFLLGDPYMVAKLEMPQGITDTLQALGKRTQFIIERLGSKKKEKLIACLNTFVNLGETCLAKIPRIRRLDLVDQLTFLMRRHVPNKTPQSTVHAAVSQLLARFGYNIKPASIDQRERRKKQ